MCCEDAVITSSAARQNPSPFLCGGAEGPSEHRGESEALTYRMSQAFSDVLRHVHSEAASQRGDQRPRRGLGLQPRLGVRGGGGGGHTASLGIRTTKKRGWFQSLHSGGENNPFPDETKKNQHWTGGDVPLCVGKKVWIHQPDVLLLVSCLGKKKKKRKARTNRRPSWAENAWIKGGV